MWSMTGAAAVTASLREGLLIPASVGATLFGATVASNAPASSGQAITSLALVHAPWIDATFVSLAATIVGGLDLVFPYDEPPLLDHGLTKVDLGTFASSAVVPFSAAMGETEGNSVTPYLRVGGSLGQPIIGHTVLKINSRPAIGRLVITDVPGVTPFSQQSNIQFWLEASYNGTAWFQTGAWAVKPGGAAVNTALVNSDSQWGGAEHSAWVRLPCAQYFRARAFYQGWGAPGIGSTNVLTAALEAF
jgi:hypothetical protein